MRLLWLEDVQEREEMLRKKSETYDYEFASPYSALSWSCGFSTPISDSLTFEVCASVEEALSVIHMSRQCIRQTTKCVLFYGWISSASTNQTL